MRVVFSDRAYAAVMAETAEKIQTETGGLFLGGVEHDTWYIIEAIDPGPKSVFEVAYFEYDQKYTQHLINKIANLYEEKLSLIGLWHRHPGSLDVFSTTDNGTNAKYAQMRQCGAISALINIDPDFRLTMYHVSRSYKYTKISYGVGNNLIPEKYMKLKTPQRYEQIMKNILYPKNDKMEVHSLTGLKSFMDMIKPFFKDRLISDKVDKPILFDENIQNKIIDTLVADISFMSDEVEIKMSAMQKDGQIVLVQDVEVFFMYAEKSNQFIFVYDGKDYIYEDGLFENIFHMVTNKPTEQIKKNIQELVDTDTKNIIDGVFRFIGIDRNGEE